MPETGRDSNGDGGTGTIEGRGMSTVTEHGTVSEKFRQELQQRWSRMGPEDRAALAELSQILLSNQGEDQDEVWEAYLEIAFPESFFETLDVEEPDDQEARKWVDAYRLKVGKMIRDLRVARGLTQEQLAAAAGLPQSHISRLECGKHTATYVTIERIAAALGAEPGQLDPGVE